MICENSLSELTVPLTLFSKKKTLHRRVAMFTFYVHALIAGGVGYQNVVTGIFSSLETPRFKCFVIVPGFY